MRTVVSIAGMRGEYCKRALFTALTPVEGIRSAEVTLGRITIEHDGSVTESGLREAIEVTGYVVANVVHERRVLPVMDSALQTHFRRT
ncbi:MAG: heavy-metal-associated domain-containing protein [Gemmatimonadaceae bacterium]